ncbi:MAG TPA: hypothetical protein VJB12_03110 [Candidatus Nanoarchaeia archaeon]|nr:hypothetical protein [Candidatus Nanoarchaeia archaeon]
MTRWGILATIGLLLISFLSMTMVAFSLSGYSFILSAVLLMGLLGCTALGVGGISHAKAWGWSFITLISLIIILYSYFVYMVEGTFDSLFTLLSSSIILFMVALINFRLASENRPRGKKPRVQVYGSLDKMEPLSDIKTASSSQKPVSKTFTPGKYVSSKFASTYHIARCEWANNIKKGNRVWFATDTEAKKAGMKPHSCIG